MPKKKKSPSGDNNWLRIFYQLCGLDPARAEIAIARRNKKDPASVEDPASGNRGGKRTSKKLSGSPANGNF
jgi:hypothetical protein